MRRWEDAVSLASSSPSYHLFTQPGRVSTCTFVRSPLGRSLGSGLGERLGERASRATAALAQVVPGIGLPAGRP